MFVFGNAGQITAQSANDRIRTAGDFLMPVDGEVISMSVYGYESATDNLHTISCGIYETATGNLVGSTTPASDWTTTPGWHTYQFASPLQLTKGVLYTIAVMVSNEVSTAMLGYTSTDSTKYYTSPGGSWPDPITWDGANERIYSIYALVRGPQYRRAISATGGF